MTVAIMITVTAVSRLTVPTAAGAARTTSASRALRLDLPWVFVLRSTGTGMAVNALPLLLLRHLAAAAPCGPRVPTARRRRRATADGVPLPARAPRALPPARTWAAASRGTG